MEMTTAVDELQNLLKQASEGSCFNILGTVFSSFVSSVCASKAGQYSCMSVSANKELEEMNKENSQKCTELVAERGTVCSLALYY